MPTDKTGWWETERAELIRDRIDQLAPTQGRIVDVGCGRGTVLDDERLSSRFVVKVDPHLWDEWSAESGIFVCAEASALPFRSDSFDLVGSFDVIEHLHDDVAALREQRRIARPGGLVVTSVPADPRLWSAHDDAVGHLRRYETGRLRRASAAAGLEPTYESHFFSFLWLPALLLRSRAVRRSEPNGRGVLGTAIRSIAHLLSSLERRAVPHWSIPLGTSLWVESRVPTRDQSCEKFSNPHEP